MDRKEFLKLIAVGTGGFLLSGFSHPKDNLMLDLKTVVIYDNYIRGSYFFKKHFANIHPQKNEPVELQREPENIYDRFAIKVYYNRRPIGYLPAYENIILANMLDNGVKLNAVISDVNNETLLSIKKDEQSYIGDFISVKIETKLLVPINRIQTINLTNERADNIKDIYRKNGYIDDDIFD